MAIEEPKFTIVSRDASFEVRDYVSVVVAEVVVTGDMENVGRNGFRQLAGYIFGGNNTKKRIAMTAPVTFVPKAENAPGSWNTEKMGTSAPWTVRFTMPSAFALDDLPHPENPNVELKSLPAGRFAVLRFSGLAGKAQVASQTAELMHYVSKHGLSPAGPVSLARYDPPWTLWFMRRNEVMVPVEMKV